MNKHAEEYNAKRESVTREFAERVKREATEIRANPERFTFSDAMARLPLDEAIALHKGGKLAGI